MPPPQVVAAERRALLSSGVRARSTSPASRWNDASEVIALMFSGACSRTLSISRMAPWMSPSSRSVLLRNIRAAPNDGR